nr:hypothetical protein CFP56_65584 [Quercus suber]
MKNEPLSNLAVDSKKQKLGDVKGETVVLPSIQIAPSSPTPSLEVTALTPPITCSKGKGKVRRSVWDDLAIALGRAHNVVMDNELKGLSSIPSHELVLGESLRITSDYLSTEEKVVVVNSKLESVEVESSKLRKDLIVAMDETNKANEKVKELSEALGVEKALVAQKDEEIQVALLMTDMERDKVIQKFMQSKQFSDLQFIQYFKGFELQQRWKMKHHSLVVDFSNLDFEKIDTKILTDKAKELE